MFYEEFILKRHPENPIINPADFPGAEAIMNPGQTMYNGKTILLVAVFHRSRYYRGKPGVTTHVAESEDGIHFEINPEPFLQIPDKEPYKSVDHHPIDTRITKIEDTYYIIHPASGPWGTVGILGKTKDFRKHEYIEIISLPDNRVPCLFPEKINGKYMRVDRPYRVNTPLWTGFGNLWISSSPDLIHWGCHRPLLKAEDIAGWGGVKIGPTPPIKTDKGWLMITHGVSASPCGRRYCLGAILMDLNDPTKIIGKTKSHILAPYEPYEQCGCVPNVVFTCGAIPDYDKDQIRVYYGAADTCVGLATGSLSELIEACLKEL
ncbi:MAG: glycoside hydrolase family 130 protein [Candidatus Omnitrophica bacterium]|nr:glycoside hydrolase family 130 protein [Candidatus Omnitrophota bacterium]